MRRLVALAFAAAATAGELDSAQDAVIKAADSVRPSVVTVLTPEQRDFDLTGVAIAPGGVVLTVRSAMLKDGRLPETVPVRFPGKGSTLDAELLDEDESTDTAIYKASGSRARAVSVARGEDVRHGMWVLLVGNTFGAGRESMPSLSLGVISAVVRRGEAVEAFHTSAMVNPGSLGAPLVDLSGDLVGIALPRLTDDGLQTIVMPFDRIREAYRAKGGKGASVVGRPPPPRRFRSDIADVLGPVLQDAAQRGAKALVAVRAIQLPEDAQILEEEAKEKEEPAPGEQRRPPRPPAPRRIPGAQPAWDRSSGVVVDPDGLVLCPLRVTGWPQALRPLKVDLPDGRTFDATVAGTDERLRLALLRIPASGLAVLERAPEAEMRAGALAVALGYPHGQPEAATPQLTFGILSRTEGLGIVHPAFRALQTDAAVNGGNRGGPVVDIEGRLLGVICDVHDTEPFGYASKGHGRYVENAGLGFAVPWTVLDRVVPRLAKGDVLKPVLLGVQTMDTPDGLVVAAVTEKNSKDEQTAAHAAGLAKGDLLLSLDGDAVRTNRDLRRLLARYAVGDTAKVAFRRGEERREAELKFTEP